MVNDQNRGVSKKPITRCPQLKVIHTILCGSWITVIDSSIYKLLPKCKWLGFRLTPYPWKNLTLQKLFKCIYITVVGATVVC
uniref:Uncharacterized protein n=1 Tax=Octopus bimaculoides TaxID=37653 RepID=A0A0L8HQJ9_OCTBM